MRRKKATGKERKFTLKKTGCNREKKKGVRRLKSKSVQVQERQARCNT
jgi:hypothetical protein